MHFTSFRSATEWLANLRLRRARRIIERSGLFDERFYRSRAAELPASCNAIDHYLRIGSRELNPNQLFETSWYARTYASVLKPGDVPLLDFIRHSPDRNPGPQFDAARYLEDYPDVMASGANPLAHYLRFGRFEGRSARLVPNYMPPLGAILTRYESWLSANALSKVDVEELRERLAVRGARLPKVSIIVPVHRPNEQLLARAIESVCRQLFDGWELWLVNDSDCQKTRAIIDSWTVRDERIGTVHLGENRGISAATNAGAAAARGDVLLFLDQDDELSPDCVAAIAIHYADFPASDLVYSDDDKIDGSGRRYDPQFKPDWSPALLLSWMYIGHVLTVRRSLFESLGGFRSEFDGAQDYDFALRAAEVARRIGHVSRILYHWRAIEGSTALSAAEKPQSIERGRLAIEEALQRRGISRASVIRSEWAACSGAGAYSVQFGASSSTVAVVLEVRSDVESLQRCLELLNAITPAPAEILVVMRSLEHDWEGIARLAEDFGARFIAGGVAAIFDSCMSDILLFLSTDLVPPASDWLSQLLGWMDVDRTAVVGARIHRRGRLVEAGRIRGSDGLPVRAFEGLDTHHPGYLGLAKTTRESCFAARRCFMTSRKLFSQLGGFADEEYGEELAAADFCSRAAEIGYATVICGSVDFEDLGDAAAGSEHELAGIAKFRAMHGRSKDPWYSRHLSSQNGSFEIGSLRPEIASSHPIQLAAVSHNLNREGASIVLFDLLRGLKATGAAEPFVFSPVEGPLRNAYEAAGVEVVVNAGLDVMPVDSHTQEAQLRDFASLLQTRKTEVVLANTLRSYWAVSSAALAAIPCLWAQHESDPWETYFDYLPADVRSLAFQCFAQAYQVIYVAEATLKAWRALETRHNFRLIRHGIPPAALARDSKRWTRRSARAALALPSDALVICLMGTVCERKGQLDVLEAYSKLAADLRDRAFLFIVGGMGEELYGARCFAAAAAIGSDRVKLSGPVDDPFLYYRAADVALCTSRIESAPRVLAEAMASSLPIVTTPVFGIPEMVAEDVNALFYDPGDTDRLAIQLEKLMRDEGLRMAMAGNSPQVLGSQPGFAEMLDAYTGCIRQAAALSMNDFLNPHRTFRVP
jgi:glycosyltransferase involved in cell wall biosynthesis/GT2 family glycosyltransferase